MPRSPIETVLAFMDRINGHNVSQLLELMTEDHAFVDSLGKTMRGRKAMTNAWQGYFAFCPDYWVSHEEIFEDHHVVVVIGAAGGTIRAGGQLLPENKWQIPAAWRAVVEGGLVREWRVYADNKPVYDIMAKSPPPTAK